SGRADSGSKAIPNSRRPGLFQDGVTPPGQRPPGSGSGGDKDHRGGYRYYPYYDPFYDTFYNGGYGFNPYYGPFGAEDYYFYGYNRAPYDRSRMGPEQWPDGRQGHVQLRLEPRDVQVFVDGVLGAGDGRATLLLLTGWWPAA